MSEVYLDSQGNYDDRDRSEVLPDYKFHDILDQDLSDITVDKALANDRIEEELRDDTVYFVEKEYFHTFGNVDASNAHKINSGPENKGKAGDLDVGKLHIPSGKLTKIELKSPGRIPPRKVKQNQEQVYEPIKCAEKQNKYLKGLLDNLEDSEGVSVPYSSEIQAWNDVVTDPIENIYDIPKYSSFGTKEGAYICTTEAESKIRDIMNKEKNQLKDEEERLVALDEYLFKGRMLGDGQNLLDQQLL